MGEYQPIWFDYNKIVDELLILGDGGSIQMNVMLYNRNMKGEKKSFHTEYVMKDKTGFNITLKRKYNFYLSINKSYDNAYCIITLADMILVKSNLERVAKWFENGVFFQKDGHYHIMKQKQKRNIEILLSAEQKTISFTPIVISKSDEREFVGVEMDLYGKSTIDLTVDRFFAMKYLFDTIDMFTLASNMLNYISRPENGTNMIPIYDREDEEQKGGFFYNT